MLSFNSGFLETVNKGESHVKPALPEKNILNTFSKEDQDTILEIVNFCSLCVEKYFEGYNIPPIPLNKFFVFDENSAPEEDPETTGLYDSDFHAFGVRSDALHAPSIIIHEMIHFIAKEHVEGIDRTGFNLSLEEEIGDDTIFHETYLALNEGMTDLMAEEIMSLYYKDIKRFFSESGKTIESFGNGYDKEVEFVQKLIDYNAILISTDENIPQEDAHRQVWDDIKKCYLTNNTQYLETLFSVFTSSEEEKEQITNLIKDLEPIEAHEEATNILIQILDKHIVLARAWNAQQNS